MTTTTIPAHPSDIGLPYSSWLEGQQEMVDYVNSSDKRFVILQAGPGRGKSLAAVALAQLMVGKSVCILATTKALVAQYLTEFKNLGFAMIEGRSTYDCDLDSSYNASNAACTTGFKCPLKTSGRCTYYRLKAQAQVARVVITDVAYFLTTYLYADGLRLKKLPFDIVIVDEADLLEGWLLNTVVIRVTRSTFRRVLNGVGFPSSIEIPVWREWAEEHLMDAKQAFADAENYLRVASGDGEVADVPAALRGAYRRAETVLATIKSILPIPESEHWVVEVGQGDKDNQYDDQGPGFELKPVWAAPYAQRLLYDHATEKVVFMSGTIPSGQQFAKLVGIPDGEWDYKEFGGVFPASHRPFYYVPTVKVHHGMTSSSLDMLIARVDQIVSDRLDRKGIIQTGSYWMAEEVYSRSMWGGQDGFMLRHGQGGLERALTRFRAADAPAILVSPALTRGVDLPGHFCTYTVMIRVPWPSLVTEQMRARAEEDKTYASFVTALQIEQQAYRGLRGPEDLNEIFMLDDVWRWFRAAYKDFFSESFRESWRDTQRIPPPMDISALAI